MHLEQKNFFKYKMFMPNMCLVRFSIMPGSGVEEQTRRVLAKLDACFCSCDTFIKLFDA